MEYRRSWAKGDGGLQKRRCARSELPPGDFLPVAQQEIGTSRDKDGRIGDDHISRYVRNWADTGFVSNDWALGYNDAIRTFTDDGASLGGQLARRYLIPFDSRTGSSTTVIWGSLRKWKHTTANRREFRIYISM